MEINLFDIEQYPGNSIEEKVRLYLDPLYLDSTEIKIHVTVQTERKPSVRKVAEITAFPTYPHPTCYFVFEMEPNVYSVVEYDPSAMELPPFDDGILSTGLWRIV